MKWSPSNDNYKIKYQTGIVIHTHNSSTHEAEAWWLLQIQSQINPQSKFQANQSYNKKWLTKKIKIANQM